MFILAGSRVLSTFASECKPASCNIRELILSLQIISYHYIRIEWILEMPGVDKKLSAEECAYLVSYLRGLCHLLKRIGVIAVALECFMQEAFTPLMKMIQLYGRDMLHEIIESLLEVVSKTNSWELIEQTMIPFLLRSVALSMDINPSEDKCVIRWNGRFVFWSLNELQELGTVAENVPILPLTLSCYILSCILDAAMDNCQPTKECTTSLLLPSLLKAFAFKRSFEVCIQGESYSIFRQHFFMKLWKCARVLFAMGTTERRDAYCIISLYLSYFSCADGSQFEMGDREGEFDIRAEKDFWDEIKRGLVEKEGLVRKQSLNILKKVIFMDEGGEPTPTVSEKMSFRRGEASHGMRKRDLWAEEEAQSLGVGKICFSVDMFSSHKQKWGAFILLYEMLEEYGTHLVEAAWNHQIMLLLHSSEASSEEIDDQSVNFVWLAVLWERGLFHDNPLVRCLIMKSFLEVDWKSQGNCRELFPEDFVLGAFMQGLNDPVHHKDFGVKGVHSSRTIEAAARFVHEYCILMCQRERISFLSKLASVARQQSLGRVGLMNLSECIVSAREPLTVSAVQRHNEGMLSALEFTVVSPESCGDKPGLIDSMRFLLENSKQHFNPNYRRRVCENVVKAGVSVVSAHELPLETLLHFIGALPREFTDRSGSLKVEVQKWLAGNLPLDCVANSSCCGIQILDSLSDFPRRFTMCHISDAEGSYDDADLDAWFIEVEKWARVLFLLVDEEYQLEPLLKFIEEKGVTICHKSSLEEWVPAKFFVLLWSLVQELQLMQQRIRAHAVGCSDVESHERVDKRCLVPEKFADVFMAIMEDLTSFCNMSCSIFWSDVTVDSGLPGSVIGKLGGPSQRRLSSPITKNVLQAILSVRTVAAVSTWCAFQKVDVSLNDAFTSIWQFFHKVVSSPLNDSETSAEIRLAAYEASSFALKTSVPVISSSVVNLIQEMTKSPEQVAVNEPILDFLVRTFLNQVNGFLAVRHLARTRKAVLMNWKWQCLEALLSIPYHAHKNGIQLGHGHTFFSDGALRFIFDDLVDRLRASMEHYLDDFSPVESITPVGIFSNRVEVMEFECVPMSLLERVMNFLNDVREELRSSMAKDEVTLKNQSLMNAEYPDCVQPSANVGQEQLLSSPPSDLSLDFQKKISLSKHEMLNNEIEKEDQLLEQILHSKILAMNNIKANRQQIIIVASLLDRIPNLAGLARTCEVFKASGLAIADANVLQDKQFQLISVTAEKWIPIIEVPVNSVKNYLEKKKRKGFSILGLEQTANSIALDKYSYPHKTVLVLGREKEGIPADIIHILDACIEIPQLGVVRSLNVHVSGAIAIWEYTRQQRTR